MSFGSIRRKGFWKGRIKLYLDPWILLLVAQAWHRQWHLALHVANLLPVCVVPPPSLDLVSLPDIVKVMVVACKRMHHTYTTSFLYSFGSYLCRFSGNFGFHLGTNSLSIRSIRASRFVIFSIGICSFSITLFRFGQSFFSEAVVVLNKWHTNIKSLPSCRLVLYSLQSACDQSIPPILGRTDYLLEFCNYWI